ncbi:MAG: hypothetical protein BAJALOKI2v1_1020005 [Promethearchaeota archaeon]|nr:MAG: hypothetical protein BAJALOKI2v1_1020005 [Candidatus Lokiarchaeota archaeon]
MNLSIESIYRNFKHGKVNFNTTTQLLISEIENNENIELRLKALQTLVKIRKNDVQLFKYLENLLVSDISSIIRKYSVETIGKLFMKQAFPPMKWAFQFEKDLECKIAILKVIASVNSPESSQVLINEIKKIKNAKYINKELKSYKNKFRVAINNLIKSNGLKSCSQKELSEIIINFYIIKSLTQKFYSVNFEVDPQKATINQLDLSDIEYEVRGWKAEFKNNITESSQIISVIHLKDLSRLDLSNNQLKSLEFLKYLPNLKGLNIANNRIDDPTNIKYINTHQALKYINLEGNKISSTLKNSLINSNIKVKTTQSSYF